MQRGPDAEAGREHEPEEREALMRRHELTLWAGLAVAGVGRLTAQADSAARSAAAAINTADLTRHLGVLAADSMRSRVLGGAGLERTARYVIEQFQSLGLAPAGDDGTWIQRYPVADRLTLNAWRSSISFTGQPESRGKPVLTEQDAVVQAPSPLHWDTDIILADDTVLPLASRGGRRAGFLGSGNLFELVGEHGTVLAGPHTQASVRQADLHDKVVIYLPPSGADSATQWQVVEQLRLSSHVVIITDEDSVAFARRLGARRPPIVLDKYDAAAQTPRHWVLYLREAAVRRALRAGGVDVAEVRASRTPITRQVTMLIWLDVAGAPSDSAPIAPNVVGMVPARDSRANANQSTGYVVFTASMDQADGSGAYGSAAGVVGLLELARAFRRLGGLRYPVVFAAVSGSAEGFRGSRILAEHFGARTWLNITLGQISGAGDSLRVAGLHDIALPTQVEWAAAQHPELGLTVVDDGTITAATSDHFPFARLAIPSLYVHTGGRGAAGGDSTQAGDQIANVVRFLFYLGCDVAESSVSPKWTAEGRRRLVELLQDEP